MSSQHFMTAPLRLKSFNIEDSGKIAGYASVFSITDNHGDIVEKGAFSKSLDHFQKTNSFPKMLWQHQAETPIGKWTLFKEDDYGLYVEGQLLLTLPKAQEVYEMIKNKMVDGLSIGCRIKESIKGEHANERILKQIDLLEISLVTFAANQAAKILSIKSFMSYQHELMEAIRRAKEVLSGPLLA
jgi:HK97 family phage prohead protease